jgi:hypothetical protein
MNIPNGPGTSKRPSGPEAEARLLRENISLPAVEPDPGTKTLSDQQVWKAMRRNRIDWVPFYWVLRSLWSK